MPLRIRTSLLSIITSLYVVYKLFFAASTHDVHELAERDIGPAADEFPSWVPQLDVQEEVEVLQKLGLTSTFEYRRICMTSDPQYGVQRSAIQDTRLAFFRPAEGTKLSSHDLGGSDNQPGGCMLSLDVPVPFFNRSAALDCRGLMLGMATTLPRLIETLPTMAKWLGHTGTILNILITDHEKLDSLSEIIDQVTFAAWSMGIELIFDGYEYPWESDGRKSFALSRIFDWHKEPETRWFGIIDDDTFIVSIPDLLQALDEYDATKPYYIGSLTEGVTRLAREGFKASAGAGIFISVPLMSKLVENYDDCRELDEGYADLLWRDCIIEVTSPTVPLTQMDGLNQLDLWKDVSGWYEKFHTQLHTIHHWRSWHYHPVPVAHLVADVAGPKSLLQRYGFLDDTVLSNGYSLVHYPHGVPDLNLVELSMVEDVGVTEYPHKREFVHSLGRVREVRKLGRTKVQWKFETAISSKDGAIKQFYVKRAFTRQGQSIDSVIQIDWTLKALPKPALSSVAEAKDTGGDRKMRLQTPP